MKTGTKVGWLLLAISIMFSIWVIVSQQNKAAGHIDANGYAVDDNGVLIAYPHESGITIPGTIDGISVTTIQNGLFSGDDVISTVVIADSVTDIGTGFTDCAELMGIYIGAGVSSLDGAMFAGDAKLSYISVDPGNPYYSSQGGCVYNAAGSNILIVPPANTSALVDGSPALVEVDTSGENIYAAGGLTGESAEAGTATLILPRVSADRAYKIYRSETPTGEYRAVAMTKSGASSYTDRGLTSGSIYYYYVRECYVLGNGLAMGDASSAAAVFIM